MAAPHRRRQQPVDLAGAAELVGVSVRRVKRAVRRGQLPPPLRLEDQDCWNPEQLWTWAADFEPKQAAAMPLKYWPAQSEPAEYVQAREIRGGVVQDWYLQDVPIRLVWPLPQDQSPDLREAAQLGPAAAQVIRVGPGIALYGPELRAFRTAVSGDGESVSWLDLAHVLGGPTRQAPYWPYALRTPELLTSWQPGDNPAIAPAVPALDTTPLLRLAAMLPDGSPAERTLVNLAQTLQTRETRSAQIDLDIFSREERYDGVLVAAVPLEVPEVDDDDLDEGVRRAGWLEILDRRDTLAIDVVRSMLAWDGGSALPFSKIAKVDPTTKYGKEWAARLVPAPHRTAAFEIPVRRYNERPVALLVDPETDAPAIRGQDGLLAAGVPQRLPANSPLAEVVLDDPIWVRVQDGTLFIAPEHNYYGMAWGYGGSGPGTLALMLHRLLDDINAPAADSINGAPDTLEEFTQVNWPPSTVFAREDLEAIRAGEPYQRPPTNTDDPTGSDND